MERQYSGSIEPSSLKPIIAENSILFPVSSKVINLDQYCGDARSFGYIEDDGLVTVVKYQEAVGVLVDDTIAMFKAAKEQKRYVREPSFHDLDILEIGDGWKNGLDREWLKDEEDKEWAEENYWLWPSEWRQAYDEAKNNLHDGKVDDEFIVYSEGHLKLYKNVKGYYFSTKHFDHGKPQMVTTESALDFLEISKAVSEEIKRINDLTKKALDNVEELKGWDWS